MNFVGLSLATDVLVQGGSAGGLAVISHIDHIAEVLHWASVRAIAECGYFQDYPDVNVLPSLTLAVPSL